MNNRAFFVIAIAGMLGAIATGVASGLELYFSLYFFGLNQEQISVLTVISVAAAAVGLAAATPLGRRLGKKAAGVTLFTIGLVCGVTPVSLRLLGILPPNGDPIVFATLMVTTSFIAALASMVAVLLLSMMADVVEDAEVKTGRRSEGLLFAANSLFAKVVSGVGVFASGVMLTIAGFPSNAQRGQVPEEALNTLGLLYVPTVVVLYGSCILMLLWFPIDRNIHQENLRKIRAAAMPVE